MIYSIRKYLWTFKVTKFLFFVFIFFIILVNEGCRKFGCPSYSFGDLVTSPYQNPVWHPSGKVIGFNHQVIKSIGFDDCEKKSYGGFYPDSSGFWLVNKDGTNLRRLTNFLLSDPAWSPDGNWIAFDNDRIIYKMYFNGVSFDTTQIIALTDHDANHFFPSWSPTGDTIFYDSNKDAPVNTSFYSIWKVSAAGGVPTRITDTSIALSNGDIRMPFCTPDNRIVHTRYPKGTQQMQVFIMDANGKNIKQITHNANNFLYYLGYFNNRIFYEGNDLWNSTITGEDAKKIITNSTQGFSIAKDGTIAFVNFDSKIVDHTHGTIWLSDINGNNQRPITYNKY